MQIGIIGSGNVAKALGHGFIKTGHTVMISSRDPKQEKVQAWVAQYPEQAKGGSFQEAAKFGEVLVIATEWNGTKNALELAGVDNFARKTVIDVTNPLDFSEGQPPKLALGFTTSAGEEVQKLLPEANVVKAFNTVGNPHMFQPFFPDGTPDMFYCGNDAGAKNTVAEILATFGWNSIDLGDITCARYLEPLAMIWIRHYGNTGSGNHAFKLLRK